MSKGTKRKKCCRWGAFGNKTRGFVLGFMKMQGQFAIQNALLRIVFAIRVMNPAVMVSSEACFKRS